MTYKQRLPLFDGYLIEGLK